MKRFSPLDQPSYCDLWVQYVMKRFSPLDQPSYCDLWMQYVMKRFSPLDQPSYCDLWMQYVMKRFSDVGNYLYETSKYANIEMTVVAKNEVNLPTHYHKYGANNHVYISYPRIKWVGNHNQRRKRRDQSRR